MRMTTLGRTGLTVSKVGLGCGGYARLGQAYGCTESESVSLVQHALTLGINILDTATSYGTEAIIGKAIAGRERSSLVICTKHPAKFRDGSELYSPEEFASGIDASLRRLRTDYIDVFFVHGVVPDLYDYVCADILPVMERAKTLGKIRFMAVSEAWSLDTTHAMLGAALPDNHFDVVMVGFNILNQSARRIVFPLTRHYNVGTLNMFSVRTALSNEGRLRQLLEQLAASGSIDSEMVRSCPSLEFLTRPGVARSIPDAAYRFCAHEPGVDVVLTGTGNATHLEQNVRSILAQPLPPETTRTLTDLFKDVNSVTGN